MQSTSLDTMEKVISIYGGTEWRKIEGMFLLGASAKYPIDSTGGEATHKLTVTEMPAHAHFATVDTSFHPAPGGTNNNAWAINASSQSPNNGITSTGGGAAHNNMPPYKTVYIWERTA